MLIFSFTFFYCGKISEMYTGRQNEQLCNIVGRTAMINQLVANYVDNL